MHLFSILEGTTSTTTTGSMLPTILMLVAVVAVFFFMSRSQKKQDRKASEMRNAIMVGDEITTIGGIIGRVVKVTEETVVIETSRDRTKMHILKSAVRSIDVHAADTIEAAEKAEKQAAKNDEKNDK